MIDSIENSEISIKYYKAVDPEILDLIRTASQRYGQISEFAYDSRKGAIDLFSILTVSVEIVSAYLALKVADRVSEDFVEGFLYEIFGEDFFKKLGKKPAKFLKENAPNLVKALQEKLQGYLAEVYDSSIYKVKNNYHAIELTEVLNFDGVTVNIHITLNHAYVTRELLLNIPEALENTAIFLYKRGLPKDFIGSVQLYPNFESDTWDYLFVPTGQSLYIDRYVDLTDGKIYHLRSADEFKKRFSFTEVDTLKFLLSPNQNVDPGIYGMP